ncbi:DUF6630 family protein [Aquabacterium sp.]|uniref:DUF6630 family protein n=1 Tax=Aquabacterium sp. TaxID=1872578 RepID=UPI002C0CA7C1|nr:hypothetical protein [Aquabacterium sp.]HSW06487.1 hypothetical protein [Aquabacterium sp.]
MIRDNYSTDQILSAEKLLEIINPSADLAHQQIVQFREALLSEVDDDGDDSNLLWVVKDVVDWESGYFVDWKDTESFVHCVMKLADRWGVTLTFGSENPLADDFLSRTTVPDLMNQAHSELLPKGLVLWNWDTEGDCYCGWITKSISASAVAAISATLGIEVRSGDRPF